MWCCFRPAQSDKIVLADFIIDSSELRQLGEEYLRNASPLTNVEGLAGVTGNLLGPRLESKRTLSA